FVMGFDRRMLYTSRKSPDGSETDAGLPVGGRREPLAAAAEPPGGLSSVSLAPGVFASGAGFFAALVFRAIGFVLGAPLFRPKWYQIEPQFFQVLTQNGDR